MVWGNEAFCFQLPMAHLAPKCCMCGLGSWPSLALLMGPSGTSLNWCFFDWLDCPKALWVCAAGHLVISHSVALEGLVQSHCDLGSLEIFHHLGVGKWQSLGHDLWTGQHWHVLFGHSPPFQLVQWHLWGHNGSVSHGCCRIVNACQLEDLASMLSGQAVTVWEHALQINLDPIFMYFEI